MIMRSEALKKAQDKYLSKQPPVVSIRFNWRQWEALQAAAGDEKIAALVKRVALESVGQGSG